MDDKELYRKNRSLARRLDSKTYCGSPCKKCANQIRYTISGKCFDCAKKYRKRVKEDKSKDLKTVYVQKWAVIT